MISARDLLVRGLLAGLLAGIAAFFVAYTVGEPSVGAAIAVEESGGHAADGHTHGSTSDEPAADGQEAAQTEVPRSLQSTAGLATATVVAGVTLGGLVGAVSALALGRFGRLTLRGTVLLVTGLGFAATYVVPFLAYPPDPPAVGQADTIGRRTALYFILVAVSLVAGVTAVLVARRLAPRWGAWYAALACAAAYGVVMVVTVALMPGYDEVPADFPAGVLYDFRRASLLTQVALWGVVAVATAELAHRLAVRGRKDVRPTLVDA
ncbi:MAG: CbtA family protein [Janthinobacterium lividum]